MAPPEANLALLHTFASPRQRGDLFLTHDLPPLAEESPEHGQSGNGAVGGPGDPLLGLNASRRPTAGCLVAAQAGGLDRQASSNSQGAAVASPGRASADASTAGKCAS